MKAEQIGIGGAMHTVYVTEQGADIAPTCFAMCLKRLRGMGCDVEALRQRIAAPLVLGQGGTPVVPVTPSVEDMAGLMAEGGLNARAHTVSAFGIASVFRQATARKIFIAQIEWDDGDLHYVVIPGTTRAGQVIALDPYHGGQLCQLCPKYAVRSTEGARAGRFTGRLVEVWV